MTNNYSAWSVISGETPTTAKWNILGTNDADFHTRLQKLEGNWVELTYSSNIEIDCDLGYKFKVTLTGDAEFDFINATAGQAIILRIQQNVSGGHTSTFDSNLTLNWDQGVAPAITEISNESDMLGFIVLDDTTDAEVLDAFVIGLGIKEI